MSTLKHAVKILTLKGIGNLFSPPISAQAVDKWKNGKVPPERCPAIESATGGAVTRRDLRPDDWWLIWPELVTDEYPIPVVQDAKKRAA